VKVDVRAVVVKYHYSYRFFTYSVKRCRNLTSKNLTSKDLTFKSKANDLKIVLKDTLGQGQGLPSLQDTMLWMSISLSWCTEYQVNESTLKNAENIISANGITSETSDRQLVSESP